jgi:hypothetical protein
MLIFLCPKCGTKLSAPEDSAGKVAKCTCGQAIQLPKTATPPPLSSPDKTALGKRVGHMPTSVVTERGPNAANVSAQDKTTLGKVVSHTPTAIQGAAKAKPPLQRKQPLAGILLEDDLGIPRKTPWALLILLVLASGTLIAGLVVYFHQKSLEPIFASAKPEPNKGGPVSEEPMKALQPQERAVEKKETPADKELPPVIPQKEPLPEPGKNGAAPKTITSPEPEKEPVIPKKTEPPPQEEPAIPNKGQSSEPEKEPVIPKKVVVPDQEREPVIAKKDSLPEKKAEGVPGLNALVEALRTGTNDEKAKAAQRMAAMGEKAATASRALCEATLNDSKDVSRTALMALEKANPKIHGPVFTLTVDGQPGNHINASLALRQLGESAKPAAGVLVPQIRKRISELGKRNFSGGWGDNVKASVILEHMVTLASISSDETETVETIIECATSKVQPLIGIHNTRKATPGLRLTSSINGGTTFRHTGIALLGAIAGQRPKHQKTILPVLEKMLEDSVSAIANTNNQASISSGLVEIDEIGSAVLKCGERAKESLTKTVIPQLKELEFHNDASVRSKAKALRIKIESAAQKTGRLSRHPDALTSATHEFSDNRAGFWPRGTPHYAERARRREDSL